MKYTINDARREVRDLIQEGYGFDAVRIFINDLVRGKDITNEDRKVLMRELMEDGFSWGVM